MNRAIFPIREWEAVASLKDILSRASAEGVPFDRAMVVELPNGSA